MIATKGFNQDVELEDGFQRSIRFMRTRLDAVVDAAEKAGLTPSSFVHWAAAHATAEVLHLDGAASRPNRPNWSSGPSAASTCSRIRQAVALRLGGRRRPPCRRPRWTNSSPASTSNCCSKFRTRRASAPAHSRSVGREMPRKLVTPFDDGRESRYGRVSCSAPHTTRTTGSRGPASGTSLPTRSLRRSGDSVFRRTSPARAKRSDTNSRFARQGSTGDPAGGP